jgi:DNA-binding MarR family transcriptional regulator
MDHSGFDLEGFLPYLLNQAAEACGAGFQRIYKERYGMLRAEWRVLFHLGQFGPMTAGEIATRSLTHKTKISRAVAALEDKRFVLREGRIDDRRSAMLVLTQTGQAAFSDLRQVAADYESRMLARIEPAYRDALKDSLRRLIGAA